MKDDFDEMINKISQVIDNDTYKDIEQVKSIDNSLLKSVKKENKKFPLINNVIYKFIYRISYVENYKDINNFLFKRINMDFIERCNFKIEKIYTNKWLRVEIPNMNSYFLTLFNYRLNNFKNQKIYKFDNIIHQELINSLVMWNVSKIKSKIKNKLLF